MDGVRNEDNPAEIDAAAAKLLKVAQRMPEGSRPPVALGVIVASGPRDYRRKDGVYVLPICSLRD